MIGDSDSEADALPSINAAIGRHGLRGRVHLVSSQPPDRLALWYSAADLFCLATSREGSANVLLESLACGVPCVTTDMGDSSVLVGDVGRVVPRDDPQAMAAAWTSILSLPTREREDLSINARKRIVSNFQIAQCVERHLALYRELGTGAHTRS